MRSLCCLALGKLCASYSTVMRAFCSLALGKLCATYGTVVSTFCRYTFGELCTANVAVVIVVVTVSALACRLTAVCTCVRVILLCVCALNSAASVVTSVILGVKVRVTYCINFFCISVSRIILTGISHNTLIGAGRSGCYSALVIVSELGNVILSNKNFVAYRALLSLGKTLVGAGRSYCGKSLFGVRKLFNSLCIAVTARAGKGLFACR